MQSISNRHIVLDQFGLTVELADDKCTLRVTPASRITSVAREYIKANKEALLDDLLGKSTFTPVGDLTAGVVTVLAPTLPTDLLERANLICQLEQWPEADRLEWLDILRRQIDRDRVPVHELVACLDAHLAVHHGVTPEAIRIAA